MGKTNIFQKMTSQTGLFNATNDPQHTPQVESLGYMVWQNGAERTKASLMAGDAATKR